LLSLRQRYGCRHVSVSSAGAAAAADAPMIFRRGEARRAADYSARPHILKTLSLRRNIFFEVRFFEDAAVVC